MKDIQRKKSVAVRAAVRMAIPVLKAEENGKLLWLGTVEKVCQLMNADCRKFVFRCEIEMRTGLDCIRKCCAYSRNHQAVNFYIAAVLKSY